MEQTLLHTALEADQDASFGKKSFGAKIYLKKQEIENQYTVHTLKLNVEPLYCRDKVKTNGGKCHKDCKSCTSGQRKEKKNHASGFKPFQVFNKIA